MDAKLAKTVADELGIDLPPAQLLAAPRLTKSEVKSSKALSLFAHPGDGGIRTRRIAILVSDGVAGKALQTLHTRLLAMGAVPRFVGARRTAAVPSMSRSPSKQRPRSCGMQSFFRMALRPPRLSKRTVKRSNSSKTSIGTAKLFSRSARAARCWMQPEFPAICPMERQTQASLKCRPEKWTLRPKPLPLRWPNIGISHGRAIRRAFESRYSAAGVPNHSIVA